MVIFRIVMHEQNMDANSFFFVRNDYWKIYPYNTVNKPNEESEYAGLSLLPNADHVTGRAWSPWVSHDNPRLAHYDHR